MSPVLVAAMVLFAAAWLRGRLDTPRGRVARPAPSARSRHRTAAPGADGWAHLLDQVAAAVRAGESLTIAWRDAITRLDVRGCSIGPATTIADLGRSTSTDRDEVVVIQAVTAAATLGGPVAATLDAGAALLRERHALRAEARAQAAQAWLSAKVLTAAPLLVAAWGLLSCPSFRSALTGPVGISAAASGAGCNAIGWWWMRRLVRVAVT